MPESLDERNARENYGRGFRDGYAKREAELVAAGAEAAPVGTAEAKAEAAVSKPVVSIIRGKGGEITDVRVEDAEAAQAALERSGLIAATPEVLHELATSPEFDSLPPAKTPTNATERAVAELQKNTSKKRK